MIQISSKLVSRFRRSCPERAEPGRGPSHSRAMNVIPARAAALALLLAVGACAPTLQSDPASEPASTAAAERVTLQATAPAAVTIEAPKLELLGERSALHRLDPPGAGGAAGVRLGVRVTNPNLFPLDLSGFTYHLYLGEDLALSGRNLSTLRLGPLGSGELELDLDVGLAGRPELVRTLSQSLDGSVPLRVAGEVRVEALGRHVRYAPAFLFSGAAPAALAALETPTFELVAATATRHDGGTVVRLTLVATNPGGIGYFLHGHEIALLVDGVAVGTTDVTPRALPARSQTRFGLDVHLGPGDGRTDVDAALARLAEPGAVVTLEGDLLVDVPGRGSAPLPSRTVFTGHVDAP
jgi:hypothetical protein